MASPDTVPGRAIGYPPVSRLWKRLANPKIPILIVAFLVVWKVAATATESYIVPEISEVIGRVWTIVGTPEGQQNLVTTLLRVLVGLACAFAAGLLLGLFAGVKERAGGYLLPVIRFIQGIPSLSWVIIAVIWFGNVEIRVWFVIVLVTLPGFVLQTHDSYRAIPLELRDMARSFRPTRWALFREITLPAITPDIFTAWKVNLGLGIRMVLIAELVGATVGVGSQLLGAQQLFDMAAVLAWTLLLAMCMLIMQGLVELLEAFVLRYRASVADHALPPSAVKTKGVMA